MRKNLHIPVDSRTLADEYGLQVRDFAPVIPNFYDQSRSSRGAMARATVARRGWIVYGSRGMALAAPDSVRVLRRLSGASAASHGPEPHVSGTAVRARITPADEAL